MKEEGLRKSTRPRKLTEKGQAFHEEMVSKLQARFNANYEKWKSTAKQAKRALDASDIASLHDHIAHIQETSGEVMQAYEELRSHETPDGNTRRRIDTCDAVSQKVFQQAQENLAAEEDERDQDKRSFHWSETRSAFILASLQRSKNSSSRRSSQLSAKRQDAAAEVAAAEATLLVLEEMERGKSELEMLEKEMEPKKRELERLETVKQMNAAKARLEAYEQEGNSDEELSDLLHGRSTPRKLPSKPVRHSEVKIESSGCNPYAQPVIPKDTTRGQPASNKTPEDGITALATALAESINISRLPVPEPAVFNGDPIKYKDWKMSFQLLIERKNIPVAEKIYYLRKYVGGPARKAVESYFLLGTEMAYRTAWNTLEERYGSPFVIAKAFRDKLSAWPRIGTKDNVELRELSDFLKGCEVAMIQIKSLQILNDCYENQRMLSKLPDWLTARWNRKVVEIEDQCGSFPTFSHFVNFVEKEARIACNPVTSLSALKANDSEKEKAKTPMTRNVGARTLTYSTEEKTDTLKCEFCERSNHNILTCRKFMEKENAAKVQFVKDKGLCFGCLKSGHISKKCEKRSICNTCKGKHPTCLHEERDKESRKNKDIQRETKGTSESKETKQTKEPSQETPNEAISNRIIQSDNTDLTSTIVPVWLSTKSNPEKELLLYALLDSQSDTTLVLQEKADVLDTDKKDVQLKLSTLSSKDSYS
ncbi:uncharacterized protein [Nerophis lumbriciformis]|uniref:uncharacterized protein n=1 Tax=Nerophis lumbriciformis TaxID=546530 RepID=UPI002AE087AC|nr:uncharacterized protein LOC133574659 [Nerophis lumbriciformis]